MTYVPIDQHESMSLVDATEARSATPVEQRPSRWQVTAATRWAAGLAAMLLIVSGAAAAFAAHHKDVVQTDEAARRQLMSDLKVSLPAALSYDYRHLDSDLSRALTGLTPRFATDYRKLFQTSITPTARRYQGVVTAEVVAVGVESAGRRSAQVLAFVNQTTTTRVLPAPRVDSSRVRVKLRRVDGHWRIDAIYPL